jgi:hypothetical protein
MKNTLSFCLLFLFLVHSWASIAQYVPKDDRDKKNKSDSTTKTVPEKPKVEPRTETKVKKQRASSLSDQSFGERLIFGGSTWLQLGTLTRIDLFPTVGYKVTDKFIAGVGLNYQYLSVRYNYSNGQSIRVTENYYGGRVFGQYFVVPPIFVWAELEATNGNFFNQETQSFTRKFVYNPMIGAGYQQGNGDKLGTGFYFLILYNLNYDEFNSQYSSPWVTRVGFAF